MFQGRDDQPVYLCQNSFHENGRRFNKNDGNSNEKHSIFILQYSDFIQQYHD